MSHRRPAWAKVGLFVRALCLKTPASWLSAILPIIAAIAFHSLGDRP